MIPVTHHMKHDTPLNIIIIVYHLSNGPVNKKNYNLLFLLIISTDIC